MPSLSEPRTLFSWIHLSDIHFGHGAPSDRYDQKLVLERLYGDLDLAPSEDKGPPQRPDAIFVTGDIAFSGGGRSPDEYPEATAWLRKVAAQVGLGARDVFVVPGNHDVNRAADKSRNTARLLSTLRGGTDEIDTVLADAGDRKLLEDRMRGYLDFAAGFAPGCLTAKPEGRLFWVHHLVKNGLTVRIAGLNTALLCAEERRLPDGRVEDDRGKLRLGKQQLHEALGQRPAKGEIVIALGHHPLRAWLEDADARFADTWIKNNVHVHLFGHVHEQETEAARAGGSAQGIVRVVSGAAHNERQPESWIPAGHGYNWGAVVVDDHGDVKLRIWPRRWSDPTADFRLDTTLVPRGKTWAEHPLSVELPPGPSPSATTPAAGAGSSPAITASSTSSGGGASAAPPVASAATPKPVEVFYFHAPDDADLLKKLDTHLALLRKGGAINTFDKRSVAVGASQSAIDARVETATVFLAMASPDFIASDYFGGPEWKRALDRVERGDAVMFTVYLRRFDRNDELWRNNPISKYKAFPDPYDNLGEWVVERDLDTMFSTLAGKLRQIVQQRAKP